MTWLLQENLAWVVLAGILGAVMTAALMIRRMPVVATAASTADDLSAMLAQREQTPVYESPAATAARLAAGYTRLRPSQLVEQGLDPQQPTPATYATSEPNSVKTDSAPQSTPAAPDLTTLAAYQRPPVAEPAQVPEVAATASPAEPDEPFDPYGLGTPIHSADSDDPTGTPVSVIATEAPSVALDASIEARAVELVPETAEPVDPYGLANVVVPEPSADVVEAPVSEDDPAGDDPGADDLAGDSVAEALEPLSEIVPEVVPDLLPEPDEIVPEAVEGDDREDDRELASDQVSEAVEPAAEADPKVSSGPAEPRDRLSEILDSYALTKSWTPSDPADSAESTGYSWDSGTDVALPGAPLPGAPQPASDPLSDEWIPED